MRKISCTLHFSGAPITIKLGKVPRQWQFKVFIGDQITDYIISKKNNEIEYSKGPKLTEDQHQAVCALIKQYFPKRGTGR